MSLFPSEHFSISLTPTAIGVAAYHGRWRPQRTELFELPVEGAGLEGLLSSLASALKSLNKPGATIRFTVSNRFCRVALLPWAGGGLTDKEHAILARRQFEDLYGDMASWEIRSDACAAYAQSSLAFAMPGELLAGLKALVRDRNLTCHAINANAVVSWNRYGAQLSGAGLFAVVEPESLFLMSTQGVGKAMGATSARMLALSGEPEGPSLELLIERELLLCEQGDGAAVFCDGLGMSLFGPQQRFRTLSYPADIRSPALAMAANGGLA